MRPSERCLGPAAAGSRRAGRPSLRGTSDPPGGSATRESPEAGASETSDKLV